MTSVSTQVSRLIPQYIHENYREFSDLVGYYLKFIEETHVQNGQILHRPQDLLNNLILSHDIDQTNRRITPKDQINDADVEYTVTKFLEFYKKNYLTTLPYFGPKGEGESHYYDRTDTTIPESLSTDFINLVKRIRDYYRHKGNVTSFKFFFLSIFNVDSEVDYPKKDILRVSDGEWYDPYYARLAFYPDGQLPKTTNWIDVKLLEVNDIDTIYNRVLRAFEWVYDDDTGDQVFNDDGSPKKNIIARAVIGPRVWFSNLVEAWETSMVPWITLIEREGIFEPGSMVDICELCDDTNQELVQDLLNEEGMHLRVLDSNFDTSTYDYVGPTSELPLDGGGLVSEDDQVAYVGSDSWGIFQTGDDPGTPSSTLGPEVNPEYIGIETRLPGRWLSNDGFLSDRKFLQDNFYYQDFSYEIKTTISRSVWDQYVQQNLHPAGMLLFNVLLASDVDPVVFTANYQKVWQIYWTNSVDIPYTMSLPGAKTRLSEPRVLNVYNNSHRFQTQDQAYSIDQVTIGDIEPENRTTYVDEGIESWIPYPEVLTAYYNPMNTTWVFVNGRKLNAYDDYVYVNNGSKYTFDWKLGRDSALHPVFDDRPIGNGPFGTEYDVSLFHINDPDHPVFVSDYSTSVTYISSLEIGKRIELSPIPSSYYTAGSFYDNTEVLVFYKGRLIPNAQVEFVDVAGTHLKAKISTDFSPFVGIGGLEDDMNNVEPEFEIILLEGRNKPIDVYQLDSVEDTEAGPIPPGTQKDDVLIFVVDSSDVSQSPLYVQLKEDEYYITQDRKLRLISNDYGKAFAYVLPSYIYQRRKFEKSVDLLESTADKMALDSIHVSFAGRERFFDYAMGGVNVYLFDPLNMDNFSGDELNMNESL